jgi:hypothetical protein
MCELGLDKRLPEFLGRRPDVEGAKPGDRRKGGQHSVLSGLLLQHIKGAQTGVQA